MPKYYKFNIKRINGSSISDKVAAQICDIDRWWLLSGFLEKLNGYDFPLKYNYEISCKRKPDKKTIEFELKIHSRTKFSLSKFIEYFNTELFDIDYDDLAFNALLADYPNSSRIIAEKLTTRTSSGRRRSSQRRRV
jgi:hypothetical protein